MNQITTLSYIILHNARKYSYSVLNRRSKGFVFLLLSLEIRKSFFFSKYPLQLTSNKIYFKVYNIIIHNQQYFIP